MHDGVVGIALERASRELPEHPRIERVVHKQVRQDRRNCRPLRGALRALFKSAVWMLRWRGQPAPHVQQHPAFRADRLNRFENKVPRDLIEELGRRDRSPSRTSSIAADMPQAPHEPTHPADSHMNPRRTSVRPTAPTPSPRPSARPGQRPSARPASDTRSHAASGICTARTGGGTRSRHSSDSRPWTRLFSRSASNAPRSCPSTRGLPCSP